MKVVTFRATIYCIVSCVSSIAIFHHTEMQKTLFFKPKRSAVLDPWFASVCVCRARQNWSLTRWRLCKGSRLSWSRGWSWMQTSWLLHVIFLHHSVRERLAALRLEGDLMIFRRWKAIRSGSENFTEVVEKLIYLHNHLWTEVNPCCSPSSFTLWCCYCQ